MDPLMEEEIIMEEEPTSISYNPLVIIPQLLAEYGWFMLGGAVALVYLYNKLSPRLHQWREAREDALHHKDPDRAVARLEAIQRAREKQQEMLQKASERALEAAREREEKKRAEIAERLEKYGNGGGKKLGTPDDDYLPLSGGASTSSYRPPKKSACAKGGCGR